MAATFRPNEPYRMLLSVSDIRDRLPEGYRTHEAATCWTVWDRRQFTHRMKVMVDAMIHPGFPKTASVGSLEGGATCSGL